jgi:hypothetical protein
MKNILVTLAVACCAGSAFAGAPRVTSPSDVYQQDWMWKAVENAKTEMNKQDEKTALLPTGDGKKPHVALLPTKDGKSLTEVALLPTKDGKSLTEVALLPTKDGKSLTEVALLPTKDGKGLKVALLPTKDGKSLKGVASLAYNQ